MKLNNMASRRAFLEELPTADLGAMLRDELGKEKLDDNLIRLILDVLETREIDRPVEIDAGTANAVKKFEDAISIRRNKPAKLRWPLLLKVASIILVVGLLLFTVPQAANAESFFEMLARWTDSIFEFFSPGDDDVQPEYVFETDHPGLQEIYDAAAGLGVTDPIVPMWVPDGYTLKRLDYYRMAEDAVLFASLVEEERNIYFTIILHDKEKSLQYEKDEREMEQIEINGINHYIFSNLGEHTITWMVDMVECSIVSNCQKEELIKLLNSIYAMEEH